MIREPIYLDHHATTPVDERVLEAMLPYFARRFGNAASRSHRLGWDADQAVRIARQRVAELVGARSPREIVFTSGATESNNLAIKGVVESTPWAKTRRGPAPHIITSAIEHPCVLATCEYLEAQGVAVTRVGVDKRGLVDPTAVEGAIRPETVLISVMAVNNEVGTVQDLTTIGGIAARHGVPFHTDAAQALGRVPLHVVRSHVDLLSLSAHKLYGPKGVGALYVRRRSERAVRAQVHGGGQEGGMRAGSLNVPGIVGLGEAAELARLEWASEADRLGRLRDALLARLEHELPNLTVFGCRERRVSSNLSFAVQGINGDQLLAAIPDLAMSAGAACSSGSLRTSHVLGAMGVSPREAQGAVRIGLGRSNSAADVTRAADLICAAAHRLLRTLAAAS